MFDYHPSIFICIHSNTGCNYFQIHAGGNKSFPVRVLVGMDGSKYREVGKLKTKLKRINFESSSRGWKGQLKLEKSYSSEKRLLKFEGSIEAGNAGIVRFFQLLFPTTLYGVP